MMEAINSGQQYMKMVQHGVHMNLNSALYGLVTPPRRMPKTKKRMSIPEGGVQTPPPSRPPFESLSKSLPKGGSGSAARHSPSRLSPCLQDGKGFYAGAKFGERPPPTELPKPPNHWVKEREQSCIEMTNTLKVLLKVQS